MKKLPYQNGTWFAIPLRNGGYAVGVVARMSPKGKIILGYFFGPRWDSIPTLFDVTHFQAKDAKKCLRVGDLGLINGEWPVIGDSKSWEPALWPMPPFVKRDLLSKRTFRIIYSDADPGIVTLEEPAKDGIRELETNALYGYGAVELLLTKLL